MPQWVVALNLDLPVQVRAIQTASIVRIIQEGLGDPVPGFPAARLAEGVLGPLSDCKVCRDLRLAQLNLTTFATHPADKND
jgi:hypothetical protein